MAQTVVNESGAPNAVAGILFHQRLYDTLFEVLVFTLAAYGVTHLLKDEGPKARLINFTTSLWFWHPRSEPLSRLWWLWNWLYGGTSVLEADSRLG